MSVVWQTLRDAVGRAPVDAEFPFALVATAWVVARILEARAGEAGFERVRRVALPPYGSEFVDAAADVDTIEQARGIALAATTATELHRGVLVLLRRADIAAERESALEDAPSRSHRRRAHRVGQEGQHLAEARIRPGCVVGEPLGQEATGEPIRAYDCPIREAPVVDPSALQEELRQLGRKLGDIGVCIAVLPELTCPPELTHDVVRQWFVDCPRLVLVVAGSFHVWRAEVGPPVNRAAVLHAGGYAWEHEKRGAFRIVGKRAEKLSSELFCVPAGCHCEEYREDIAPGTILRVLECDLGRIAVVVCADVLDTTGPLRSEILERVRPDLVLISSMSDKTAAFLEFAGEAFQRGIHVLFANARCIAADGEILAFGRLALPDFDGHPATAIWRNGGGLEGAGPGWSLADDQLMTVDFARWHTLRA